MEIGQNLHQYRIVAKLGAGGMGDVYRARDSRLEREVAIKVVPEDFGADPERLARFEREAKVLASLNHPHIAQIHGLEEDEGRRFLVLELVEGNTLAGRIAKGAIPIAEALPIAIQIAEGLEAAHERGIVHRDLKPANIMLTRDGQAKVLDFGIAKPLPTAAAEDHARTRTFTGPPTRDGVIMGTPAYMSPEQVRGQAVDRRSDIWAFGAVLWEMLTGKRLFDGETDSDTLSAVLQATPNWKGLPPDTPRAVRRLLHRCLEPEPRVRLHDIADARLEIDDAASEPLRGAEKKTTRPVPSLWQQAQSAWQPLVAVFALALLVAGVVLKLLVTSLAAPHQPHRLSLLSPPGAIIRALDTPVLAVSPDGRWVVFTAEEEGTPRLFKRSIEGFDATVIPGTEYARHPFFSPDGRWVGFFAEQKLKKVSLADGLPLVLCDAKKPWGATWGPDDSIVFTPTDAGELWRVAGVGGEPVLLLKPNPQEGVWGYFWPEFLPDGKSVLFTAWTGGLTAASASIGVLYLEWEEEWTLIENASYARYLPTGHLVYGRGGRVELVPFDPQYYELTGPSVPVPEQIIFEPENGVPHLAFSADGSLFFVPGGGTPRRQLVSVDLEGNEEPLLTDARGFAYPRFSPDGERLAVTISEHGNSSIWVLALATGAQTKLPVQGNHAFPVWSPDGERIVFAAETTQPPASWSLFSQQARGPGPAEVLLRAQQAGDQLFPYSWSPDGRTLVFGKISASSPESQASIWLLPLEGDEGPQEFAATELLHGVVSPDGRWIAHTSDESGRSEIYVQRFPDKSERHQVSTDGGTQPIWSPDGTRIHFWTTGPRLMAVSISTAPEFRAGAPRALFQGRVSGGFWTMVQNFDLSPDGEHFVIVKPDEEWGSATEIRVVLNWFDEVKRLAPPER